MGSLRRMLRGTFRVSGGQGACTSANVVWLEVEVTEAMAIQ